MNGPAKFYVNLEGNSLGYFDEVSKPEGAIEVPPPDDARRVWDFSSETWSDLPTLRVLPYADFKARFSGAEMAAIRQAVLADSTGQVLDWTLDAAASNTVRLDSENCAAFLDKMIAAGILTAQRKAEVLA